MNNAEILTLLSILAASESNTDKVKRGKVKQEEQEEQEVKPAWKPAKSKMSPAEYRRLHKGKVSNG